jgi:hypothetical protein
MSGGTLSLRARRHVEVGADGRGGDHGDEGEDNRCICDGKGPAAALAAAAAAGSASGAAWWLIQFTRF